MPELPEVETVRRGLIEALDGRIFTHVAVHRPDLRIPFPPGFATRLTGRRVIGLRRRAKYLLFDLDGGESLIVHLGMSGRLSIHGTVAHSLPGRFHNQAPAGGGGWGKHDHVVFETDKGARIVFTDHRRFGLMSLAETATLARHDLFADLGPEPLDAAFTPEVMSEAIAGKKAPIKSALLDQRVVAGLGNIYVCEALFRAGISPKRNAASVAGLRASRLVPQIKAVLEEALVAGGSSLRDYAKADGELGYFQHRFAVYDREGEPCRVCNARVRRIVQAGRSTFYCGTCQR